MLLVIFVNCYKENHFFVKFLRITLYIFCNNIVVDIYNLGLYSLYTPKTHILRRIADITNPVQPKIIFASNDCSWRLMQQNTQKLIVILYGL